LSKQLASIVLMLTNHIAVLGSYFWRAWHRSVGHLSRWQRSAARTNLCIL